MKFDVVIGNPPYVRDTHLKFLAKAAELSTGDVVFVHPSAWLIKQSDLSVIEQQSIDLVKKYNTTFSFIKGMYYFRVAQYTPCVITHIQMNTLRINSAISIYDETNEYTWNFNKLEDVNFISDSPVFFELRDKIKEIATQGNIGDMLNKDKQYYVTIPKIRGSNNCEPNSKQGLVHRDFYTMIAKDTAPTTEIPNDCNYVSFDTLIEAENFIKYIKTDFARFCLALLKFDANIQKSKLLCIPSIDFTKSMSSIELYKMFNITEEMQAIIKKVIPEFY